MRHRTKSCTSTSPRSERNGKAFTSTRLDTGVPGYHAVARLGADCTAAPSFDNLFERSWSRPVVHCEVRLLRANAWVTCHCNPGQNLAHATTLELRRSGADSEIGQALALTALVWVQLQRTFRALEPLDRSAGRWLSCNASTSVRMQQNLCVGAYSCSEPSTGSRPVQVISQL